jgi:hypothetical protein
MNPVPKIWPHTLCMLVHSTHTFPVHLPFVRVYSFSSWKDFPELCQRINCVLQISAQLVNMVFIASQNSQRLKFILHQITYFRSCQIVREFIHMRFRQTVQKNGNLSKATGTTLLVNDKKVCVKYVVRSTFFQKMPASRAYLKNPFKILIGKFCNSYL